MNENSCITLNVSFGSLLCENSGPFSTVLQIVEFSCSLIELSYENRVKLRLATRFRRNLQIFTQPRPITGIAGVPRSVRRIESIPAPSALMTLKARPRADGHIVLAPGGGISYAAPRMC